MSGKLTIKDVEEAIRLVRREGYVYVEVTDCPWWKSEHPHNE
jgi:hypothetical protein